MTSIDSYKCQHLFLLMGHNPLPNYVAAKLLTRTGSGTKPCLYLVYSQKTSENAGTEGYANYLGKVLGKQFDYKDIPVKESDPRSISDGIAKKFPSSGTVGLHYTGGTKAMAVHAYMTIAKERGAIFSYLNPRRLEMCFDPLPGQPAVGFKLGDPQDPDHREYFQTTSILLTDLLALHGLKKREPRPCEESYFQNPPRSQAWMYDLAKCLLDISLNDTDCKIWRNWCKKFGNKLTERCREQARTDPNNRRSVDPGKYRQCLSAATLPLPALPALREELKKLNLVNGDKLVLGNYRPPPSEPPIDHFCEWLNGKWLEDYVLQKVLDVKDRCFLHDCGSGLEPAKPNASQEPYFEIDVVAIRGYQLFAISCTTSSDLKRCKLKLFEVFVRAPQLGGDEARIGLVCMVDQQDNLQSQLEQEWNAERGKIKVFGKRDLPRLESQLQQWFEGKI